MLSSQEGVVTDRCVVYGPSGQHLDVYRRIDAATDPVVLLWHGSGPDERAVLEPLARATAEHGVVVFVPDWRPDDADGGRAHLLESIAFVRKRAGDFGGDSDRTLLAGWSRGAKAAAGVAVNAAATDGWRPAAVACLATRFDGPTPTTLTAPLDDLAAAAADPIPVWLMHGTRDELVNVEHSRHFAKALHERGWPVQLDEMDTDHSGVVMTEYDSDLGRCVPATEPHAIEAGERAASILAKGATHGAK